MNLESLAKKTTAQREHPPSRFKSFKIGCGGPIHTEYTIFEDTVVSGSEKEVHGSRLNVDR